MKRTGIIVVLIILLILSAGTNTYLYMNSNDAVAKKQLELVAVRDSLQKELLRIEDSLNSVVMSFQMENDSLVNKISELESDKNPKILAAYREINRLRRQLINGVAGTDSDNSSSAGGKNVDLTALRKQLSDAKNRIKELVAQVDSLTTQKNQLVADVEVARNEKEAVTAENVELKDRLEKGAMPQFGTLITSAFDDAKKLTTKAKSIDRFTITFDVLENPMVTTVVEEEVTIRLIDPDGGVLSVTNKSLQDKSKVSSLKNSITFDGALQKVKWSFPPKGTLKGKLKKGKYITELWTRDLLRQKNTFELK
jgi:outer membrane murein-binding lipoprotein Lpp